MPKELFAHFLPEVTSHEELAGDAVIVIDVLRASTTICFALAAGAKEVIPCLEVSDARELAGKLPGDAVLGGERGGKKIDGFDLGNSPREYVEEAVSGKTVVFTTTNGTRALQACIGAGDVFIGAFVNINAVVQTAAQHERVHLLCAGTNRQISREDVLLAGAMAELYMLHHLSMTTNDQAQIAIDAWQAVTRGHHDPQIIARCIKASAGGRNLESIGQSGDIRLASAVNMVPVVPKLDRRDWRIRL